MRPVFRRSEDEPVVFDLNDELVMFDELSNDGLLHAGMFDAAMQQLSDDLEQCDGCVEIDFSFRAEIFAADFDAGLGGHLTRQSVDCRPEAAFVKRCRAQLDHQVAS